MSALSFLRKRYKRRLLRTLDVAREACPCLPAPFRRAKAVEQWPPLPRPTHVMSRLPPSALLDHTLSTVPRRYRLPALPAMACQPAPATYGSAPAPATILAALIEQVRTAREQDQPAGEDLKARFIDTLAQLVRDAMRPHGGDPVFQAMVLRHRVPHVREYAALSAQADRHRRPVMALVNAIAHPQRQQRAASAARCEAMAQLHATAAAASWADLRDAAQRLWTVVDSPDIVGAADAGQTADAANVAGVANADDDALTRERLRQLLQSTDLAQLQRLEALRTDPLVRQYRSLWAQQGPQSGTAGATARGISSKARGAAAEALAAAAVKALAQRLNHAGANATAPYRVVTSMRVPASIPASHERAKTEWDVVLLRRVSSETSKAGTGAAGEGAVEPTWEISLLVEVKASVDAATNDLPRLLRGLHLLGHAEARTVYTFETQQGPVRLNGDSLRALQSLPADDAALARQILYCCDAPPEPSARVLGAASRMQLLSAPGTLAFATRLAEDPAAAPHELEAVWRQLSTAPQWGAVRNQYPMLRRVRELMVRTDDLLAQVQAAMG